MTVKAGDSLTQKARHEESSYWSFQHYVSPVFSYCLSDKFCFLWSLKTGLTVSNAKKDTQQIYNILYQSVSQSECFYKDSQD